MTERERRAMLKARPDVTCWESFLAEAAARRAGQAAPVKAAHTVSDPVPANARLAAAASGRANARLAGSGHASPRLAAVGGPANAPVPLATPMIRPDARRRAVPPAASALSDAA